MKRFAPLLLVALLFSPFFAFAQETVDSHYCPNPETDFFKGSIYYENDKPWIEVKVDPDFEQKELREKRHIIGDIPLTPVYDLVVQIKPEFNYYCIPGWVEGQKVTPEHLPPFLHVTAAIVVGTKDEVVVDPVIFSRTDTKDEQDRFIYERKMKGWMQGITSEAKLERLVEEIDKSRWLSGQGVGISTINALISIAKPDGETERIKLPISDFSNCAPIWGNGRHNIVGMRATKALSASRVVDHFDSIRRLGFGAIEPYVSNQSYFSYAVDLVQRKARLKGEYLGLQEAMKESGARFLTVSIQNKYMGELFTQGSCAGGWPLQVVQGYITPLGLDGIAMVGKGYQGALVAYNTGEEIYVHEFSHTFAGVNDEYVYRKRFLKIGIPFRNCSSNPRSDFSYQGKLYGGTTHIGCSFAFTVGAHAVEQANIYRPTATSIMNLGASRRFNVISCGYILAAIKGGDAKSYFPECAKMDGVIKDGVQASALYPFFANIGNLLNWRKLPQTAAVGDSAETATGQYLIVESFDPNNPWGEIIEVVPDSQTIAPQPTPTTQPPAPAPENLGVSTESIFDTVFLDLKVNGKDGPITVEKRDRIVLSWISEGATRCRANWSRDDIKLAGTAAGRLGRSVTIRAACINAEGERADDAVRVNVVN